MDTEYEISLFLWWEIYCHNFATDDLDMIVQEKHVLDLLSM